MKTFTFVVLHGWGLSSEKFGPLARSLRSRGYQVFVPDLPGFGASKPPQKPFVLSDYVVFLHAFLKERGIHHPIFIGHSFGGRVALKYQFAYPSDVKAIILTGTPGFTPVAKKKIVVAVTLAKIGKKLFSLPPLTRMQETIRSWYYYVVGARDYYRASPMMRETFKNIVQEDLVPYMSAVQVPTALIWGEDDIITPTLIAQRMHEKILGSVKIFIPHGDHGVSYKQPEKFVMAVESFLKNI